MMKSKLIVSFFLITVLVLFSCGTDKKTSSDQSVNSSVKKQEWAIVIHGGAGGITRESITPELDKEYRAGLQVAINTGKKILSEGGSALDRLNKQSGPWKIILSSTLAKVPYLLTRERMSLTQRLWMART
jgi:hypothetical protein